MGKLGKYGKIYKDAETPKQGDFKKLPDGTHQGRIERFLLKEDKNGNPYLSYWIAPVTPGYSYEFKQFNFPDMGRLEDKFGAAAEQKAMEIMGYLKRDMETLGLKDYEVEDLENEEVRTLVIGKFVDFKKVTKKQNNGKEQVNIYISRVLDIELEMPENGSPGSPAVEEDEIPF